MNRALLVVLLVAAASAAVVSNEVPDVVEVPDVDGVTDVDVDDIAEVFATDMEELTDEAEEIATFTRKNLSQGDITSGDVRVVNRVYSASGTEGQSKVRIILIRTKRQISAIRVNRVGDSQDATPSIVKGGVGKSFAIIRIKSAVGRGYNYRVEVYVKKPAQ